MIEEQKISPNIKHEFITFFKKHAIMALEVFNGTEEGHFISVIPSLRISGYGDTHAEAKEMLEESLHTYIRNLAKLDNKHRSHELFKFGWKKAPHKNKEFRPFIDADGILRDFNFDEEPQRESLTETVEAVAA